MKNGYAVIKRTWDRGKTALQCGPIVYCFEGVDNGPVYQLYLPDDAEVEAGYRPDMLNGVMTLQT